MRRGWSDVPVRSDLTEYLAAALTSPEATMSPLVVLGQPGAGKSALTKILAARLPAADFLPVRVVLREASAEDGIQEQIEYAIRAATGEHLSWPRVAGAAGGSLPVVLVTSRTAVADRARYPEGAVALRVEPFRPAQAQSWLEQWNSLNQTYLAARGLSPLPAGVVARHEALACQPLLLMMLALYDADANALQRGYAGTGDGTNDSFIRHALEPVFRWLGPALTSFAGIGNGPATSAAYDLLNVWLSSTLSGPEGLADAYEHFGVWAKGLPLWDAQTRSRVQALVLDCLSRDASRLPAATTARVLRAIIPPGPGAEPADTAGQHIHLVLQAALAALSAGPDTEQQAELISITATAAEVMRRDPAATLQTWITLHNAGLPLSAVFGEDPGEFLGGYPFAAVADSRPELVRQATAIAAARYRISVPR